MVFIEERISYLSNLQRDKKLWLFYNFLEQKKIDVDLNDFNNQTDKDFVSFIGSLLDDNKNIFLSVYNSFSRKVPSINSPWVNNNFLIFIIIIGIYRYNIDKSWIRNVLFTRQTQDEIQSKINYTFKNIITNNLHNTENLLEIIISFQSLEKLDFNNEEANRLYSQISNNINLFKMSNDFLICASLESFDSIILSKDLIDKDEKLLQFESLFVKRVKYVGLFIQVIIFICFLISAIYFYENKKEIFNVILCFLGLFGVGIIYFLPKTKNFFNYLLKMIFGHNKIFNSK